MWNRNSNGHAEGYSAIPMADMHDGAGTGLYEQPGVTPRTGPAVVAAPAVPRRVGLRQPLLAGADDPMGAQPQHAYYPILPSQAPSAPQPAPQPQPAVVSGGPPAIQATTAQPVVVLQSQMPQVQQQPAARQVAVSQPVVFAQQQQQQPAPAAVVYRSAPPAAAAVPSAPLQQQQQPPAVDPNGGRRRGCGRRRLRYSDEEIKPHRDWFWCSCLTMVCCALPAFPCGLIAMLNAVKARSAAFYGDSRAAMRHSKKAKKLIIGGLVFAVVLRVAFFVVWNAHGDGDAMDHFRGKWGHGGGHGEGRWGWWPGHHHRHGRHGWGGDEGDDAVTPPSDEDDDTFPPDEGDDMSPLPPQHGDNDHDDRTQPGEGPEHGRHEGEHGHDGRRHHRRHGQGGRHGHGHKGEHGGRGRRHGHGHGHGHDNESEHDDNSNESGNDDQHPVDGSDKPEPGHFGDFRDLKSDIARSSSASTAASLLSLKSSHKSAANKHISIDEVPRFVRPGKPVIGRGGAKPMDAPARRTRDQARRLVPDEVPADLADAAMAAANGELNNNGEPIHLRKHLTREEIIQKAHLRQDVRVGGNVDVDEP